MRSFTRTVSVGLACSLIACTALASAASADSKAGQGGSQNSTQQLSPGHAELKKIKAPAKYYSDSDIITYLLGGVGPVAKDNPEITLSVRSKVGVEKGDEADVRSLADYLLKTDSRLNKEALPLIRSGNPAKVERGIQKFTKYVRQDVEELSSKNTKKIAAAPAGWWHTDANVIQTHNIASTTNGVIAWQVAGLHTAGAVTIYLAAAVFMFVYLEGDSGGYSEVEWQAGMAEVSGIFVKDN